MRQIDVAPPSEVHARVHKTGVQQRSTTSVNNFPDRSCIADTDNSSPAPGKSSSGAATSLSRAVIPPAAILLWSLVPFGSYRWAERIFLVMSLAFFAYPIAMILGHPHWGEVGKHLVVPHIEPDKSFILLAVALIGTTVSPYMQFYAAAGVVDRGAKPEDYRLIKLDAVIGAVFACIISLTIIIATAAAIGGTGPLDSAAQAAEVLKPVAGQNAELLFAVGLIGASALAGAVVPLSAGYAVGEAAGVERSVSAASATHRSSWACSPPRSCSARWSP